MTIGQDVEKYTERGLLIEPQHGAAPALSKDVLLYDNLHDSPLCSPERGYTAFFAIRGGHSFATGARYLFRCGSDSLFFNYDTGYLTYRRTAGGTNYDARVSWLFGEDEIVRAAVRCTSREAELVRLDVNENEEAVPRSTLSVWVSLSEPPVEETASADSVEGHTGPLYMWSDAGAGQLNDEALWSRIVPRVLTDDEVESEMARLKGLL